MLKLLNEIITLLLLLCDTISKHSGIKQVFYYAHGFSGSGIWKAEREWLLYPKMSGVLAEKT